MKKPPVFRSSYDDHVPMSDASGCDCSGDPGKTQQSFGEECDINTIVRRFGVTGVLPQGPSVPTYGDFCEVGNFQEAMAVVVRARESFAALPAEVRSRFQNDPGEFVDFCADESNFDEAARLGIVLPESVQRVSAAREEAAAAVVRAEVERELSAREKAARATGVELSTQS